MKTKISIVALALFLLPIQVFAKETLEFSCDTTHNGKATVHSTPNKAHYIYRFYKNGKLKLIIKNSSQQIIKNSLENPFANRYNVHNMYFSNQNYGYNVYTEWYLNPKTEKIIHTGGIDITKKNNPNFSSFIQCTKIYRALSGETNIRQN